MTKPVVDASKLLGFRLIGDPGKATVAAKVGDKVGTKDITGTEWMGGKLGAKEGAKVASTTDRA
jgi:hypothetical protein